MQVTGGGGGAGGFRESKASSSYTASPLELQQVYQLQSTGYPITVGGGGAGSSVTRGIRFNSIFQTITSAGGGGGGANGNPGWHWWFRWWWRIQMVP